MLTLGSLSTDELATRLRAGLNLSTGPYRFRIHSPCPQVLAGLSTLYADFELDAEDGDLPDFQVHLRPVRGLRRWFGPQVNFWLDHHSPFLPLPADHAYALLEWGMNWCLATQANDALLFHAAVLQRGPTCLVMPGDPGAGKSTLTAALMGSGWRLLSDEMAVIDLASGQLLPLARPVGLKNQSIDVIRRFTPAAVIGQPARDTHKGTVNHVRPTTQSVQRRQEPALASDIIFPRWRAGAATALTPLDRAEAFQRLAGNSFNYSLLGRAGFLATADLVARCRCWSFEYSDLAEAMATLGGLDA
jgi:hypothetical protein